MHEVNPGVGLVKREDLRRQLETLYQQRGEADPETCTRQFLNDMRDDAGLLVERGPGEYGFIHLTFEEYLAAVAIALQHQGDAKAIAQALGEYIDKPGWHEISLLTVSYVGLIQQMDRIAGGVVETLITEQPGEPGAAVVFAGEAVVDAGPVGIPLTSKEQVVVALIKTMQDAEVPKVLRRRAGLALGRLGWLLEDLDTFVEVPPGPFLYGENNKALEMFHRYWIALYPVTNVQYVRFIQAGGYQQPDYWSTEGWRWLKGSRYTQPQGWNTEWNNPLLPVVGVNWYEAEAYCRWLTAQAGAEGISTSEGRMALPAGGLIRLPTEEEWERAARGTDGRVFPWGNDFTLAHANTLEDGDIGTTVVCTYPQGVSPIGAWDMSGNVWEWCRHRLVRGGTWNDTSIRARATFCAYLPPVGRGDGLGFRVVCSLPISDHWVST